MASNIRFFFENLFDDATITASSENASFPATNLQHPFRTKVWRTAGATAGTANLVVNHGAAVAVSAVILTNYSWTAAPGTLNLEFNATDSWGAPSATEALTWVATPDTYGNPNLIIKVFAAKTYQYNRLNVVYSPGAVPTDWDLGNIFLGSYFEPALNYLPNGREYTADDSMVSLSINGQRHADQLAKYRKKEFGFYFQTAAQWLYFQDLFNTVGVVKPLWIAFDYDSYPNAMTMYGHLTYFEHEHSPRTHTIEMEFDEAR